MPNLTQTCPKCSKQFLVIEQEQKFLNDKNLPLPVHCPSCRQQRRLMLRGNDRTLYKAKCSKCGKGIIEGMMVEPKTITFTFFVKK